MNKKRGYEMHQYYRTKGPGMLSEFLRDISQTTMVVLSRPIIYSKEKGYDQRVKRAGMPE